jgi:hypothetical protein
MIQTQRRRLIFAGVAALAAVILPTKKWSPPPESLRIGPVQYDSLISSPRTIPLGTTTASNPTDVNLSFSFVVAERPMDYAYILSTAKGSGRGLKVSIDLYGNLYFSVANPEPNTSEYQLVKLSDPTPPGIEHTLEVTVDTNQSEITIRFDDQSVPLVEPRPLMKFDVTNARPTIEYVEVGGSDGHTFSGTVKDLNLVFGRSDPRVDLINVRILLVLLALSLALSVMRWLKPTSN